MFTKKGDVKEVYSFVKEIKKLQAKVIKMSKIGESMTLEKFKPVVKELLNLIGKGISLKESLEISKDLNNKEKQKYVSEININLKNLDVFKARCDFALNQLEQEAKLKNVKQK